MTSELKALLPCPFCGSEARLDHHKYFGARARCSSAICDASIQMVCVDDWNTRAPSPAVARLVEVCKAAKRGHRECEDTWYSCPAVTEGDYACSKDTVERGVCDCGADEINAKLDDAIAAVEKEIGNQ